MNDNPNQLIQFYSGVGTDSEGRSLKEICEWDFDHLEQVHNYIQWLFPLTEPSHFNRDAPILKATDIQYFINSHELQQALLNNLDMMLNFYGFIRNNNKIVPSAQFSERGQQWLTRGNHNFLRISRILKCLTHLGLSQVAQQFFTALEGIHPQYQAVIGSSFQHWHQAIQKER